MQFAFRKVGERGDPFRTVIECRDVVVFATAGGEEFRLPFKRDFFERFEAIGREARAQDVDARYSGSAELGKCRSGVWLQPLRTAKPGLESHYQLFRR